MNKTALEDLRLESNLMQQLVANPLSAFRRA